MKTLKNLLFCTILPALLLAGACGQKSKKFSEEEKKIPSDAKTINPIEMMNNSGTLYESYSEEMNVIAGKEKADDTFVSAYYEIPGTDSKYWKKIAEISFISHKQNEKANKSYFLGNDIWLKGMNIKDKKLMDILIAGAEANNKDSISLYIITQVSDQEFSKPILLGAFPLLAGTSIECIDYNKDSYIDIGYKTNRGGAPTIYLMNKGNDTFEQTKNPADFRTSR